MAEAEFATVARPYARAAFSFALDREDGLAAWSRMLGLLAAAVGAETVRSALDNPQLTTDDEMRLVASIMDDDLTPEGHNFVAVLAENGRLALVPTIAEMFERLKRDYQRTMDVDVVSAYEVSAPQKVALSEALERMLQRNVNLSSEVDESLIGGAVIRAEDTVIDDSVKGRLRKLSQVLD